MQIVLPIAKNVQEYRQLSQGEIRAELQAVHAETPLQFHKPDCPCPTDPARITNCDHYPRHPINTDGERERILIYRFECLDCNGRITVLPSFVLPHKHYDAYVIQNSLEQTLVYEVSYRGVQQIDNQLQSTGEPKPRTIQDPRTPWRWVVWLGAFSVAAVLMACGLVPPAHIIHDEKFLRENG